MIRKFFATLAASLLLMAPALAADSAVPRTLTGIEDAYKSDAFNADPMPAIDITLAAAKASGKRVLLVMGTGGCHDSAWFAAVRDRYEIVYADIGMPHVRGLGRNPQVPKRFRFRIKGTPTVAVLDTEGRVLNRKAAPKWRNAASRSDDGIYNELMN
ncbi:protein-disulfide isomerase [Sphingopyxis bauzanensis]|uniref:Protein-disulfide isomerase n=1 Tax=Sphingopyxis bauzanensis TaxID=651663 RepID=A0A246JNX9_9SPHN|nr:protein-disulfide isomerase [Sphingopyxis bauzanensis]OWQ94508.1 protein-disulfide isomerase [Sphingopyxis bauzanensis]GGJ54268.1 hypothetical protein GCM10011393_25620 [Sphingopyxis bauzanensis]